MSPPGETDCPGRCQGSPGRTLGISMKHYLREFYKAPEEQEVTLLGLQIKNLTNQKPSSSTYQKYVNSWQDFLTSIGRG